MGTSATATREPREQEEENTITTTTMASVPSSPPRAPLSAAESTTNSTTPFPKQEVERNATNNNGVFHADEVKPDLNDGLDHLDSKQCIERFRKYENEYTHRLLNKFFSGKNLNGGNSFYEEIAIGAEVLKTSRVPCFQLYADPVVGFEEQCSKGSTSPAKTQANTPNGKHTEELK
ncbi:uncharacterized protein [Medicago truncatula]|uniref:uncharacterized protein isoform X2 n=1 Tax=Medicago truncatula TaxID=3880 RepID=UPI000D2F4197|nr:uncharacterized protein LOC11413194 isoform X2 [Medicago truncatula]